MTLTRLLLCLLWLSTTFFHPLFGQEEPSPDSLDPQAYAAHHIVKLHRGVLLVRFPSFSNQMEVLENAMEDRKRNRRLEKRRDGLLEERENFARHLIAAFRDSFSFSEVFFTYDTAMAQVLDGARSGFLLNDDLDLDPELQLPEGKPLYTLRVGLTDYATTTRRTALIITDSQNNDLRSPFPYSRPIFQLEPLNFKRTIGTTNFYTGMDERWAMQLVGGLHARLSGFLKQVQGE